MVTSSFRQTGLTESRAHAPSMPCSQSGNLSVSRTVPFGLFLAPKPNARTHVHTQHACIYKPRVPSLKLTLTEQADDLRCLFLHQCTAKSLVYNMAVSVGSVARSECCSTLRVVSKFSASLICPITLPPYSPCALISPDTVGKKFASLSSQLKVNRD